MPRVLKKLLRWLAYTAAVLVVLLAVAIGLFRLLVPELPEYREEIERRISSAVGLDVTVATLDARWRLFGPELIGDQIVVASPASGETLLRARRVVVGASVFRLLAERQVVVNRVELEDTVVDIGRDADGGWRLGSVPVTELLDGRPEGATTPQPVKLAVHIDDLVVNYSDPSARRAETSFRVPSFDWVADRRTASLTASLDRLDAGGAPLELSASRVAADADWNIYAKAEATDFGWYLRALPASLPVPDTGFGAVELWIATGAGNGISASANVDLTNVAVPLPGEAGPIEVGIKGHAEWKDSDDALLVGFDIDALNVADSIWPATRGELRLDRRAREELTLKLSYVRFDDLLAFADWLPGEYRDDILAAAPRGNLIDTELLLSGWGDGDWLYSIDTRFDQLSWQPILGLPGVAGLSGQLSMDRASGRLGLATEALIITDPRLFAAPVEFSAVAGNVNWNQSRGVLTAVSNGLRIAAGAFDLVSDIEVIVPEEWARADVALTTRFDVGDISAARAYLPRGIMQPPLIRWFDEALVSGRLANGELSLIGRLADFPFRDSDGSFTVRADVLDTTLKFARNWPAAELTSAVVQMDGLALLSTENNGSLLGNSVRNARIEIADLKEGVLTLAASSKTTVTDGLRLVRGSPLRRVFGDSAGRISGTGTIAYELDVVYPIKTKVDWTVDARLDADNVALGIDPLAQRVSALTGTVNIVRSRDRATTLASSELNGVLLGSPVAIELLSGEQEQGLAALAVLSGRLSADGMRAEIPAAALNGLDGQTGYRATVRFPARDAGKVDFSVRVDSELDGLAIAAPYPLGKTAETKRALKAEFVFPEAGRLDLVGELSGAGSWSVMCTTEERVDVRGGRIIVGTAPVELPDSDGLWIGGRIDSLRVNAWLDYIKTLELPPADDPVLRGLRVEAGEMFAYGQRVESAAIVADRNASEWMIRVRAPTAEGAIFLPTDFDSGEPIVLRMDRLHLVEADPEASTDADPRGLPPIRVNAEDFVLGEQRFGSLVAELDPDENGIIATRLETSAASFRTTGEGAWTIVGDEETTSLRLDVISTDAAATATSLGLEFGIIAENAEAGFDVSWQGAPRADFFESLDGLFSLRIADGRLDDVDPGAGRVLGLMSVVEIPRRLSLDFRDVFAKGLTFGEITADYRLVNGEAFTCNLSLRAPSADIAIIGRASLTRRDYNQTVVVSANVGDTLPAVGAVVGGPQVAAAMLVISRIFKKPLKGLGQAYYQINGSWDDPSIERTTVERFYATSQLADCLQPAPQ